MNAPVNNTPAAGTSPAGTPENLPAHIARLAIIPAKGHSERCPGKNMRRLADRPLFLHSVSYALQEGFIPVVSTDSEEIINMCRQEKILFFREIVDESRMINCIRQVLAHVSCNMIAVLQPTSPFRQPGLLQQMADDLDDGKCQSAYTSQKIKVVGHLDGHFQQAGRMQDAKRFLDFFDGNISILTPALLHQTGMQFDDNSQSYPNPFPCCLQIDTEEEWNMMSLMGSQDTCRHLLATAGHRKRICIVSNKRNLQRNYSAFVDSCDQVMRISKMDNLDSGLAGTRTDMALVSCFYEYQNHSPRARHMDALRQTPEIYFNNETMDCSHRFSCEERLNHWKFLPASVHDSTGNFTTLSKGLCLADHLFPDAQLYYLGDTDMAKRAPNSSKHSAPRENAYMQALIDSGRLIPILEDTAQQHHYSTAAPIRTPASPCPSSNEGSHTIFINHPQWKDNFIINGSRGKRQRRNDQATILNNENGRLSLKWDEWGKENFIQMPNGQFNLLAYQYTHSINEITKYATELTVNPYDGYSSVFRHTNRTFIGMGYRQWDFLLLLDRMYRDLEQAIQRMPRLQSILLMGICKDAIPSLYLAQQLKKNFPHLHIGVWGCPWPCDYSGPSPVVNGLTLSPSHALICNSEPYQSLLRCYGDPLAMLKRPDTEGIHLFGFYGKNNAWCVDEQAADRLTPYLQKTYTHECGDGENVSQVHGKILQLCKQQPAMISSWIDEMFSIMKTPATRGKISCFNEVPEEHILRIQHPSWQDRIKLSGNRAVRMHRNDKAAILSRTPEELVLKWDRWGTETFVQAHQAADLYIHYQYTDVMEEDAQATELLINTYDSLANSMFRHYREPGKRAFIGLGYPLWDMLLIMGRMERDIRQSLKKLPNLRTVLFTGICKDSLPALALALSLRQTRPHLNIGVLGCGWTGDCRREGPLFKGQSISSTFGAIKGTALYQPLLDIYGDPLRQLQRACEQQLMVHLFSFYGCNSEWQIDRESSVRLQAFIQQSYRHEASDQEHRSKVHVKILQLHQQNPDLCKTWLNDMFRNTAETPLFRRLPTITHQHGQSIRMK